MKNLLHTTYRGAVEGARKAFLSTVIERWGAHLVKLDSAVTSPPWGTTAVWWKRWLRENLPSSIFNDSFFHELSSAPFRSSWRGPLPAYGTVGNKVRSHRVCIDDRMTETGGVPIPRMVRTTDGREVLQHELIRERAEAASAVADHDEFMVVGGD